MLLQEEFRKPEVERCDSGLCLNLEKFRLARPRHYYGIEHEKGRA
jgi:hypothetical protein